MKALLVLFLALAACKTVPAPQTNLPKRVVEVQPSFSGNINDSGIVSIEEDGSFLIRQSAADRYNALAVKYGKFMTPEVKPVDFLKSPDSFLSMSAEQMVTFLIFSEWERNSREF